MEQELNRPGADDAALEFLKELHSNRPLLLTQDQRSILRDKGIITTDEPKEVSPISLEFEKLKGDRRPINFDDYLARCPQDWHDEVASKKIMSADWMPEDPSGFDKDLPFIQFVSSTHERFCDILPYKPFFLYIMHCKQMLEEDEWAHQFDEEWSYDRFVEREFARISVHTCYFGNKYGKIKDADYDEGPEPGVRPWTWNLPLAFVLFFVDCKYSFYAVKGRQIAFTSTIGLAFVCKALTRKNINIKFVAQSDDKSKEIFRDKFKPTLEMLDDIWGVKDVPNDREKLLRVSFSEGVRGQKNRAVSTIEVIAPRADAINGGSPSIVGLDEMAFTPLFGAMVKEARPTRFVHSAKLGRMVMKRQVLAWTTGGEDAKGGGSFEAEYRLLLAKWREGKFSDKTIPLFFDWTCRTGITLDIYNAELEAYADGSASGQSDKSIEERLVGFRQHYPSSIEDCFLSSRDTLLPLSVIDRNIRRLSDMLHTAAVQYKEPLTQKGMMVPEFNKSIPMQEGSRFRWRVIGSTFAPSSENDRRAPIEIFQHPKHDYVFRYYKGTDPVEAENTTSKHSSTVWDALYGTASALCNIKAPDPQQCFEQSALLNLYYGQPGEFIPELIENNIGQGYINFMCDQHFYGGRNKLVTNFQLPEYLQVGTPINIGIHMKGSSRNGVVRHLYDVGFQHGQKLNIMTYWDQFLHFVATGSGENKKYRTEDSAKSNDDALISLALAYICRLCFSNRMPTTTDALQVQQAFEPMAIQRDPDTGMLTMTGNAQPGKKSSRDHLDMILKMEEESRLRVIPIVHD